MELTNEEKKEIRKTLKTLVRDMRKLWALYPHEEINITLSIPHTLSLREDYWHLRINDKKIIIYSVYEQQRIQLDKKNLTTANYVESDYNLLFQFIENYDEIRKKLKENIIPKVKQEKDNIASLNKIKRKYIDLNKNNEATIEIDLPETNNQHQVEVVEENGQKIGTINFGDRTIKIITNGDIVLVNKENEKTKVKSK